MKEGVVLFPPTPLIYLKLSMRFLFFFTNPAVAVFSPLFYFNFASPSVFFIFFVASSLLCCTALQFLKFLMVSIVFFSHYF